ncbi:MAG TPA: hypothetical protein VM325_03090 [Alphaproteobacteria bacterium]|nr:hypothetical protein [Alphaproteobacteria bacterium]
MKLRHAAMMGLAGLALTLGGCGITTRTTQIQTGSAQGAYYVQCNGIFNDFNLCKFNAGRACPQGYVILRSVDQIGEIPLTKTYYITGIRRSMTVRCM